MRHHRRGRKFSRTSAHRDALMMNLAGALIRHGRIKTTQAKAKTLRPYVERIITEARKDTLHARRNVLRKLRMHDTASSREAGELPIVQLLFNEVAPRFVDRPGGYTRITKLGPRPGDAAPMAYIEFVDYVPQPKAHVHDHSHAHSHSHDREAVAAG